MHVSLRALYGLRVLVALAARAPGEHVATAELAGECDVPGAYLHSILADLRRHRLIGVAPKRHEPGGYRLARTPGTITVAEVLRALSGPFVDVAAGSVAGLDRLEQLWAGVDRAVETELARVTVADLGREFTLNPMD